MRNNENQTGTEEGHLVPLRCSGQTFQWTRSLYRKRGVYQAEKAQKHINLRGSNPPKKKKQNMRKREDHNQREVSSLLGPGCPWSSGPEEPTMKDHECPANTVMFPQRQGRTVDRFLCREATWPKWHLERLLWPWLEGRNVLFPRGCPHPSMKANTSRRKSMADFLVGVLEFNDVIIGMRGYSALRVKKVSWVMDLRVGPPSPGPCFHAGVVVSLA